MDPSPKFMDPSPKFFQEGGRAGGFSVNFVRKSIIFYPLRRRTGRGRGNDGDLQTNF